MLKKYGPFWGAFLVLAALFIFAENAVAPNFQSCVSQHSSGQGEKRTQQKSRIILKTVVAESVCTLQLIDRHNGFFAALAAFIIAWFTFTLKLSTDRLWEAGDAQLSHAQSQAFSEQSDRWRDSLQTRDQIDILRRSTEAAVHAANATAHQARIAERALTDLERPYIYIFDAKEITFESGLDPRWYLEYSVANYGRTPATVESIFIKISVAALPENPVTAITGWHSLLATPILTPNDPRSDIEATIPDSIEIIEYTDEYTPPGQTWAPALKDGKGFYLWIKIKYRGPFTLGHETSACWRWEGPHMVLCEGEQYNYTH